MPSANINGATLEVADEGDGPTVVLVHGSASDMRTWSATRERLADRYRVISYSRRFHWPNATTQDDDDYAMLQHVDDLDVLLRQCAPGPVHLIGHSYGAFVCLLLAMRAPDRVRSLVLAEPPVLTLMVSDPPRATELVRLLLTRPRTALAIIKLGVTGFAPATKAAERGNMREAMRIFGRAVLGGEFHDRLSPSRLQQVHDNLIAAEFLGSGFVPLDASALRRLTVPTLLVSGERSPAIFHRLLDRLEELLPRIERVNIAGASHIMHEDNPEDFHAAVLAFLEVHSTVAG